MPNLGLPELLLILAVIVLLFGARRLPELARSLGRSSREFKAGLREGAQDDDPGAVKDAKATPPNPD